MNLVNCKFLDGDSKPKGTAYTYATEDALAVGDLAYTPENKKVIVVKVGVPQSKVAEIMDKIKYVTGLPTEAAPEESNVIDNQMSLEDDPQTVNELIVVEQLPVITERLASLGAQIDAEIKNALELDCTEENKQVIKKERSRLNKDFEELEARRRIVKKSIMDPYDKFEEVYKKYVSDKYKSADSQLKVKIDEVEAEQKERLKSQTAAYFQEYAESKNIDFLTLDAIGIKIGVSDNLTNLKKQVKVIIDKVVDDLALIEIQAHKDEILVEYKQSLNCSQSITKVADRHAAIEKEKQRQAEIEAAKAADKETEERVEAAATKSAPPPERVAPVDSAPEAGNPDPVIIVTFKVKERKSKVRELKKFLDEGGYKYE